MGDLILPLIRLVFRRYEQDKLFNFSYGFQQILKYSEFM